MKREKLRKILLATIGIFIYGIFFNPAWAPAMEKPDGFPNRPITMIVPYGAGGGSDQMGRAMASALKDVIGVPVIVVNKPGAGGLAGLQDFFFAKADGYTITQHIDHVATLYAGGNIKENPTVDFFPICIAQITFSQLYVRPDDNRFPDWEAFFAYAKANPGGVKIGNASTVGGMEQILFHALETAIGIKSNQVGFSKPAERYGSLVGGHVDALLEQPGDVKSYIESGDMKAILTLLNERPELFPDTPSLKDIGADITPLYRFRGFFVKKDVPEDRVKYLEWALRKAWESDSYQKFNKSKYMDLIDSYRDIEGGKKLISESIETYERIYKEMGLEVKK